MLGYEQSPSQLLASLMTSKINANCAMDAFTFVTQCEKHLSQGASCQTVVGESSVVQYTLLDVLTLFSVDFVRYNQIDTLLEQYPDLVNAHTPSGETVFHVLLKGFGKSYIDLSTFKFWTMLLAKHKVDLTAEGLGHETNKQTLLHHLVRHNIKGVNATEINTLLEQNPKLINTPNRYQHTPLQSLLAIYYKGLSEQYVSTLDDFQNTAKLLIQKGADVATCGDPVFILWAKNCNATDSVVDFSLADILSMYACRYIGLSEFKSLAMLKVKAGSDATICDFAETKHTLLHHLVISNDNNCNKTEIEELLSQNKELINVQNASKIDALSLLLSEVELKKINRRDAIETGMLLIDKGANYFSCGNFDKNGLIHYLVSNNSNNKYNAQIKKMQSCIDQKNALGQTPLQYMLQMNYSVSLVDFKQILAFSPNLDTVDVNGFTLLHTACKMFHSDVVRYLLTQTTNAIVTFTNNKQSLYHLSVDHKNSTLWDKFKELDTNLTLDSQDSEGNTALHLAVQQLTPPFVQWLVENGANCNLKNNAGKTAMQLALDKLVTFNGEPQIIPADSDLKFKQIIVALYAKTIDKPDNLEVQLDNPRATELFQAIGVMRLYGQELIKKGATKKGQDATNLADKLESKASDYLTKGWMKGDFKTFQQSFVDTLHEFPSMSYPRVAWRSIVQNILLALTGVGALLQLACLVYTKVEHGQSRFFFQNRFTTRETHFNAITSALKMVEDLVPRP